MAATSTSFEPPNRLRSFSISTNHASGDMNGYSHERAFESPRESSRPPIFHASDLPAISLRAFALGLTLGVSILATIYFVSSNQPLWRLPFFLSVLSLFHFLEYQITALYNPTFATVSAFLLSQNGKAYNIAHSLAFLECFLRHAFFSKFLPQVRIGLEKVPSLRSTWLIVGVSMLLVGQVTRTVAMAHAGSNFNHTVQMRKRQGHVLVTDGIYSWIRHPSYFGFFWWGLGSQVVLGNAFCLIGYAVVLWRFFRHRITGKRPLDWPPHSVLALAKQANAPTFHRRRDVIGFFLW